MPVKKKRDPIDVAMLIILILLIIWFVMRLVKG
jgi:hypothetical protein